MSQVSRRAEEKREKGEGERQNVLRGDSFLRTPQISDKIVKTHKRLEEIYFYRMR